MHRICGAAQGAALLARCGGGGHAVIAADDGGSPESVLLVVEHRPGATEFFVVYDYTKADENDLAYNALPLQ